MAELENMAPTMSSYPRRSDEMLFLGQVECIGGSLIGLLDDVHAHPCNSCRAASQLVCSVAEMFTASLAILRSAAPSHSMTLMRSMLDAYADLVCLCLNPSHLGRMELSAERNMVDVVQRFMADGDIRDSISQVFRMRAKTARARVRELTKRGLKTDRGVDKFERANIMELYGSFQFLCASTHNDLHTLASRHDRQEGELTIYDELPRETLKSLCGILLATLVGALERMPDISDLDRDCVKRVVEAQDAPWVASANAFLRREAEVLPQENG